MTRQSAATTPPVALTIAGSDSGGGAGIQADVKTMEACGAFGTSAITSVTAQNTTGVESTHLVPIDEIEAQIEAVLGDFDVRAAKTGMLATREVIETVVGYAAEIPALVVDPVMVAASGDRLLEPDAEAAYEQLIAESTLVTPNADEAAVLTGIEPETESEAREAAERLVEMGADAALVKGGHIPGDEVIDVLVTDEVAETIRHPRVETTATHGSGCTLSSAIAARLAQGATVSEAVRRSVDLLARAVRYHIDVGEGPGAVHHLVEMRNDAARAETIEAVERVVDAVEDRNVEPLVPDCGLNVAGATPYAETPTDVAAVEGKISRTRSGVRSNRGVRFETAGQTAEVLLGVREVEPALRFAARCRFEEDVADALDVLGGSVVEVDRSDSEQSGLRAATRRALDDEQGIAVAVADPGAVGTEASVFLLGRDESTLIDRVVALLDALGTT